MDTVGRKAWVEHWRLAPQFRLASPRVEDLGGVPRYWTLLFASLASATRASRSGEKRRAEVAARTAAPGRATLAAAVAVLPALGISDRIVAPAPAPTAAPAAGGAGDEAQGEARPAGDGPGGRAVGRAGAGVVPRGVGAGPVEGPRRHPGWPPPGGLRRGLRWPDPPELRTAEVRTDRVRGSEMRARRGEARHHLR